MFNKNHQKWRVRDNFRQTTLYITSIYRLSHSDDFFYQNTHTCVRSTIVIDRRGKNPKIFNRNANTRGIFICVETRRARGRRFYFLRKSNAIHTRLSVKRCRLMICIVKKNAMFYNSWFNSTSIQVAMKNNWHVYSNRSDRHINIKMLSLVIYTRMNRIPKKAFVFFFLI